MKLFRLGPALMALMIGCAGGGGDSGGTGGGGGDDAVSGGDSFGGDQRLYAPCEPRSSSGTVEAVDIEIASPLPSELMPANCASGDVTDLAGLVVFGVQNCTTEVTVAGTVGCCMDILADQNVYAVITYRKGLSVVGEQQKLLYLPTTSDPVVPLSFIGEAFDDLGSTKLAEFCAGTL